MSKRITTRIDDATHQRIQLAAKERNVDMSAIVCLALADHFHGSEVLSDKLDALRRAIDARHEELMKRLDQQVIQLGELISMLIGEQHKDPGSQRDVERHWDQVNNLNK